MLTFGRRHGRGPTRWQVADFGSSSTFPDAGAVPADWRNSRSGIEAMGVRLGLGPWDQGVHRLLSQYEAAVEAALAATRTTAEA